MNSGNLKTYKYVKITKSVFSTITILSLHSIYSESKNLECLAKCTDLYTQLEYSNNSHQEKAEKGSILLFASPRKKVLNSSRSFRIHEM